MAIICKCERCGKELEPSPSNPVNNTFLNPLTKIWDVEICKECYQEWNNLEKKVLLAIFNQWAQTKNSKEFREQSEGWLSL